MAWLRLVLQSHKLYSPAEKGGKWFENICTLQYALGQVNFFRWSHFILAILKETIFTIKNLPYHKNKVTIIFLPKKTFMLKSNLICAI